MKKMLTLMALVAMMAFIVVPAMAAPGTLYEQEGTANDLDPVEVDAAGQAPDAATANCTNWKYQYGGGSWSGIYAGDNGFLTCAEEGDMDIDVEADIEMFMTQTISNNKIYFHLANVMDATSDDLTAYVDGTLSYNNGMYVGISFYGTDKTIDDFETDTAGDFTGVITGGMQSDHDTWRAQDNQMDIRFLMNWGAGWTTPVNYGDGSHGTVTDTLWWLVNDGNPGSYSYQWQVRLLPTQYQADGDYYLDPAVVAGPVL